MPAAGQTVPAHQRVLKRTAITEGCWIYLGRVNHAGYGQVTVYPNKERGAHRVVYEALVGEVPAGMELDHLCRNRICVNPEHLEPVTHRENMKRGFWGQERTYCIHGHLYDESNTYWYQGTKRMCRECGRIRKRKSYRENSASSVSLSPDP